MKNKLTWCSFDGALGWRPETQTKDK